MATLADLRLIVRRSLGDFPKVQIDSITSYDGTTNPIPTGKDLPIETNSETVTVNGTAQVRGSDYTIDYDARQITWLVVPAAATAIKAKYKECVYKTEQVDEGINQGRRILFPSIYQRGTATFTTLVNVRDYDLRTAVNEGWARSIFSEGHMSFKIERCDVLPVGSPDQAYVPWRRYIMYDDHTIHLWELPPNGYTFRIHLYYAFKPLVDATDVTDVPEIAQSLLTEWAVATLALKQEPMRGRIDTANVLQGQFANPPGTMAQTSEDFLQRAERILAKLNTEPMVFVPQDLPARWQVGVAR